MQTTTRLESASVEKVTKKCEQFVACYMMMKMMKIRETYRHCTVELQQFFCSERTSPPQLHCSSSVCNFLWNFRYFSSSLLNLMSKREDMHALASFECVVDILNDITHSASVAPTTVCSNSAIFKLIRYVQTFGYLLNQELLDRNYLCLLITFVHVARSYVLYSAICTSH